MKYVSTTAGILQQENAMKKYPRFILKFGKTGFNLRGSKYNVAIDR
jgi:hypothetical protein